MLPGLSFLLGPAGTLALVLAAAVPAPATGTAPGSNRGAAATATDLASLHAYIHQEWSALRRGRADLARAAAGARPPAPGDRVRVYASRRENLRALSAELAAAMPPSDRARIDLRSLPIQRHLIGPGLLYLPHPYVVASDRRIEMDGWDSYFIVRGLLRDGQVDRARDMVDDAVYEVQHFGIVLSANRTDCLRRSPPPLLTRMILAVYEVTRDRGWLVSTMPAIRAQYRYWTREPHLAGNSGLSRPDALPAGPAPASRDDASVALNSLLFVIERDVAEILTTAGDLFESQSWLRLAEQRRRRIGELLWDATRGLFVDYDVAHRRQRPEPSADTFLPLWAGLASPEQARRLAGAALPLLERAGGLAAGGEAQEGRVGAAPSQLFAVEGLRRYGLHREADRLATAFLGTVLKGYVQHAAVFQEYDLDRREPAAREGGDRFGTTNGVFLELEAGLAPAGRAAIVAGAAAAPAR